MIKMESKKSQRLSWLDCFLRPKNSNSKWLQQNLDEMNRNVSRMLKMIEDSNAESFDIKYSESKKELMNLVVKCYKIYCSLAERHNDGATELLNYIPNSDLIPSQSNVTSFKTSALPLSRFPSTKQPNHHEHKSSKKLTRGVSGKGINHHIKGKISKIPFDMVRCKMAEFVQESDTQSDNDYEGSDDELEAELRDMIVKPIRYKYPAAYDPYGPRPPPSDKIVQLAERIAALAPEERRQIGPLLREILRHPTLKPISVEGMDLGAMGGAGGGPAKAEEKKVEKTAFDVKLEKFDAAAKIKVIKEVRSFTSLGLKEAKDLVEKVPAILKQGVTKEEANEIIEKIKAVGGVAVME